MSDASLAADLRTLTTDELGLAYVDMLRRDRLHDPERAALREEWSRRPKAERWAALRRCREEAAGELLTLAGLRPAP